MVSLFGKMGIIYLYPKDALSGRAVPPGNSHRTERMRLMFITKDIHYAGVNDHQVDLFEGQYTVPNGMAYNSYVILDDKIAVMDTVDRHFQHEWLDNLALILGGRKPDYVVVQHM